MPDTQGNNNNVNGPTAHTKRSGWLIRASEFSKSTFNPIRSIVDSMKLDPHPDKQMIALSIGKLVS